MTIVAGRISSMQLNMLGRDNVAKASSRLQTAGQELATGRRNDIYKDLGSKSAYLLNLRVKEDNTQAFLTTAGVLENKLQAMLTSVDSIRDLVDDVLQSAIVNDSRPIMGASALQMEAQAAFEAVIANTNISFNGDFLFSGINSDKAPLNRWDEVNAATGYSPKSVMQSIVSSGPVTATDVARMMTEIEAVFSSSDSANSNRNYERSFYNGAPALGQDGQPNQRVSALINEDFILEYGVQANDTSFRELLKGLAMLASTDVSKIQDPETYEAWMGNVVDALGAGLQGALDASATIGFKQQIVETTKGSLNAISLVQRIQISSYESIDPYEAATRMTSLETQLQASYNVSARLAKLSILSHL